ncbi:MAG: hypothetical protein Q4A17_14975 [Thermoguttaceae bacterium]|nr:hypothetical protein [Thermoguttaceae bacterium]
MHKNLIYLLIVLNSITCYLLALSQIYPIVTPIPQIHIYNNGIDSRAIVKFLDHPPWCHSRFFNADYDYDNKKIVLHEYYIPFLFLSKPINQHCELVIKASPDGEYKVYSGNIHIGNLIFFNETITWNPLNIKNQESNTD